MDRATHTILNRITRKIPPRLAARLSKAEYDTTEEEKALVALNSKHISPAKKRKLEKLLEKGAFRRKTDVIDEKALEEIDRFHTREIARARAAGKLKDPMEDKFYAQRMKRQRRIALGLETPAKQKPYTEEEINKARAGWPNLIKANQQTHAKTGRKRN